MPVLSETAASGQAEVKALHRARCARIEEGLRPDPARAERYSAALAASSASVDLAWPGGVRRAGVEHVEGLDGSGLNYVVAWIPAREWPGELGDADAAVVTATRPAGLPVVLARDTAREGYLAAYRDRGGAVLEHEFVHVRQALRYGTGISAGPGGVDDLPTWVARRLRLELEAEMLTAPELAYDDDGRDEARLVGAVVRSVVADGLQRVAASTGMDPQRDPALGATLDSALRRIVPETAALCVHPGTPARVLTDLSLGAAVVPELPVRDVEVAARRPRPLTRGGPSL